MPSPVTAITAPGGVALVISSPVPSSAMIAVTGDGKELLRLSGDDFLLRVHLPPGPPGKRFTLRLDPTQVESQVESDVTVDVVLEPSQLSVILDHSEDRRVPIQPRIGLQLADSYTQVGPTEINADSVDITGPHSLLRQINVIYTDSLFRNDVRDDVNMELALEYPDGRLVQLRPNRVRVRINVQELAEYEILNVPVAVVNGPEGAVSEPSRVSVRVRGGADLIGKLDAENDIGLTVRFELARTDEGGLIDAPKGQLFEIRQVVPARATVVTR